MNIVTPAKRIHGEKFKAVISNRIYLSKTPELHKELVDKLTYTIPARNAKELPITICDVTRVNSNIITIPSGRIDLIPSDYEVIDKRVRNAVKFPKFSFTLRESQQEVYDNTEGSCILNANASYGKTFTAIALASKLGQKTLVIVDRVFLRDQWLSEIKKCLGIEAGVIGSGKFNIKPIIVVANIQTLRNKIKEVREVFGTVIVDETHHITATVFKNVIDNMKALNKIGLSATLWRKDGKHVMIPDYLGTKIHKPKDENSLKPLVTVIDSDIYFSSDSKIPWANRVNDLTANTKYIELVCNLAQVQVDRGFKVLIVSDRVDFLETCSEILPNFKLILGGTDDRTFDHSEHDGIIGSIRIFTEGINIPALSCAIPATPINNRALLEQLIGRIARPLEGKKSPEFIDISLKGRTTKNQLAARINFYTEKGLKIRYV